MENCKRLALGAVQFGLPYGIANTSGQVSGDEAASILNRAWEAGLNTVDTAISYGESEKRLGDIGIHHWQTITKLPSVPADCTDITEWVRESVRGSLRRLKISKLYGLLLHDSKQLLNSRGNEIYQTLNALKEQGTIEKVGISIYDPKEIDLIWSRFKPDLVQAPFNVIDRRLVTSGWLSKLNEAGVEVHVRSIFLQGLLLMEKTNRPINFNRWQRLWDNWHQWLNDMSISPLQACLCFAMSYPQIGRVVVGVDSLKQLQEIIAGAQSESCKIPPDTLMCDDLDLINPFLWKKS